MESSKHTPTPWRKAGQFATVQAPGRACICDCGSRSDLTAQANAEFIARACNSHADLLAALEEIIWITESQHGEDWDTALPDALNIARAAIAKARGE